MSSYKLTYFNGKGRGEPARLLFAAGGIKYEDHRVEFAEWPELKPKTLLGYLPMLEVDGTTTISETLAIARFVAKLAGMVGKTPLDEARADMVVDVVKALFDKIVTLHFEKDETKKEGLQKELFEKSMPTSLGNLEKLASAEGYFVGNSLTWADVYFYHVTDMIMANYPDILKDYVNLNKVVGNVKSNPGIAKWLKERPETPF